MFKHRRRSAHGILPSPQHPSISSPTDFVKASGIESLGGEASPVIVNSAMSDHDLLLHAGDSSAVNEPLVQDDQQVHSDHDDSLQEPSHTPPPSASTLQPLGSHPVDSFSDEESAPAPPDFTRRGIHIPTRTSSTNKTSITRRFFRASSAPIHSRPHSMPHSLPSTPESLSRVRSSADSVISYETSASSIAPQLLVPLQNKGLPDGIDRLSPLLEDDPRSFDLVAPNGADSGRAFSLEIRSEQLFSKEHLEAIFEDTPSLLRFTSFLTQVRPKSIPILVYYLDALKAIRAINYANAVAEALEPLEGFEFTENPARPTVNAILEDKAKQAFEVLVREDLPAFITHIFIQVVSVSIQKRITGNLPPLLREASEGLAEVFCLSDPSRPDNPIVFASEEFHRTTQYGVNYAIGRNCRFLQGPRTNRSSIARLRKAAEEGREVNEVFLNYRRDGSPFMNLLLMAPLVDSRGNLRYFIGAQVDVSGLVKDCTALDAFQRMLDKQEGNAPPEEPKGELQDLSEMFNHAELDTVRKHGGHMHREHLEDDDASMHHRPRLLIHDSINFEAEKPAPMSINAQGRLSGVYKHYLLIRPHPSLRILFTSPSLRVPGVLQSRFLDRIGGSSRVRDSLAAALADGTRGVTAKIRWLASPTTKIEPDTDEGRPRWIHCTPLLGASGTVGVWMVVLVDDDKTAAPSSVPRRFRQAPPIPSDVRGQRNFSPGNFSPGSGVAGTEDSGDDELDVRSGRQPARNGHVRRQAVDGMPMRMPWNTMSRPGSAMSEQRAMRAGNLTHEPSIASFAL
ncbi:hypothetical protein BDV95DRAFT_601344 [Massariosphaeria phaeospora]|uniref:PAC domain-containing protein n=1 Tax=Massariosphaeria phaeospora TaxID=100035 RepID=A0A7C8II28_9PLEO|nr:hypothetical protein BDV95DRAFT_601344 [Massariosphaeria phaeospora]